MERKTTRSASRGLPFHSYGKRPGADLIGKDMLGNVLIVQCKRYAPRTTVGSPQIRECMGARENFAARELIFVTTSACTPAKPSTRAKLAAHAAGSP
jgi:restriction endonuclease Mrr